MSNPGSGDQGGFNPYQAPAHAAFDATMVPATANYWREGELLVVESGSVLPGDVCIATGKPANGEMVDKKLQWAHPAVAVAILVNILLYLIIYLVVRKRGTLSYALSPEFKKRRFNSILLAIFGPLASIGLIAAGVAANQPIALLTGVLAFFITLITGLIRCQPLKIKKIDGSNIYLTVKPEVFQALGL